ncbi:MAG TPA: hypothetical protein VHD62_10985 [Opitutaceae bacterium]|nr:hypothetical protein [Opitutaceae bacterium]
MSAPPKVGISADEKRNLLEIRFAGRVTAADFDAAEAGTRALLEKLRPGFTVLTDLTALATMDLDCVAPLTKMMDLFKASGVRTAVRVISDPEKDIGFNILAITHYRRGVKVITCATRAEAERALA